MKGVGGGEHREKDSDKCGSVVLIVQCCPAISPHAVPSLGDLWPMWRLLDHRMCAAPHVCLRERGRLDGYAQIIAHRGHEENEDNLEVQEGEQDRKKKGQREEKWTGKPSEDKRKERSKEGRATKKKGGG